MYYLYRIKLIYRSQDINLPLSIFLLSEKGQCFPEHTVQRGSEESTQMDRYSQEAPGEGVSGFD